MRKQLIAMTAFTIGTLCLASAAMAGEGGAEHRGPVDNEAVQPARLQGSNIGGYQNSSSGSAATSSSDSSGAGTAGGQGSAVGASQNEGDTTYGVPGKVGGHDNR